MTQPKRHHYVPQFYLKNFANDKGQIWVYDRQTKKYRQQNVRDTAVQQHYYRIETKDGTHSTEIESFLAELEGNACTAIVKLERGETLTEDDRQYVAAYVALQMTRVPDFEKSSNESQEKLIRKMFKMSFHSVEATQKRLDKLKEKIGEVSGEVSPEEMYEFIQQDRYKMKFPRQNAIRSMLKLAEHTANYFIQMDWLLLRAGGGGTFITSDNPYTLFPPPTYNPNDFWDSAVGILTPGAKKALPVSPNSCLFMLDHGGRYAENTAPRDKIRFFNDFFARTSGRFIFAKDEALLRSVVKRSRVDEIPVDRERVIMS